MSTNSASSSYALGNTTTEHERLIWQAALLAPYTERFFREAGIGPGQRILELGSGVGDVAMLTARLVGPSGVVVGIERDGRSIARARARVAEAGLGNVTFIQSNVSEVASNGPFDGAVGRFILEFVPDPLAVLRCVLRQVRPGGIVAFQEPSYTPFLSLSTNSRLWYAGVSLIQETLQRAGANTEIGLALHRIFQEAGLDPPTMRMDIPLGADPDFTRWIYDLLCSLRPQIQQQNLSLESLGDFDTLPQRLRAEAATAGTVVPFVALVAAWSRRTGRELENHTQRRHG
jgi:protein-L-isoaspartate O-methyltransferase